MLDTRIVGSDDILHLNSLWTTERVVGDYVESHQCATIVFEGFERLRGNQDANRATREHGARYCVVATLAVGKIKQIVTILLLYCQSLGQIDVSLQSSIDAIVIKINLNQLGLSRIDCEVIDVEGVNCSCAQ